MSEAAQSQKNRYILIVTVRDEEEYLEESLGVFTSQTVLPTEIVIVNDGSTDRTPEIADSFAERFPWVHVVHRDDRGERKLGGGVVDAFYAGHEKIKTEDYDFICKIDGDVTFDLTYFEELLKKFAKSPRLGGASGKLWNLLEDGSLVEHHTSDHSVFGGVNFWRKECWEEIGGFVREVSWDGITWHRCRMLGWETRSYRDEVLKIIHHRLMGSSYKSVYHGRLRGGRGEYFMGTHFLYIVAFGVFRMKERPYIIGGFLVIVGFIQAALGGMKRYDDLEFRRNLRRWQMEKIHLPFLAPKA